MSRAPDIAPDSIPGPPADLEAARVMDALRRVVRALRVSTHASERDLGVSAAQLFVLRQLALAPRQSVGELATRTRTSQGSVSEVVSRLVAHGFVERHTAESDRRRAELSPTAEGRAVLARASETIQERLLAGLARMSEEQRRALAAGMDEWLASAGLGEVPATMFFEPTE
jgi:MarR family transcriptional regulator, organic hydroperoxide resistance regulator